MNNNMHARKNKVKCTKGEDKVVPTSSSSHSYYALRSFMF